jgi:hypothetical protein
MSRYLVFLQFHIRCVPHRWRARSGLAARAQLDCAALAAPDAGRARRLDPDRAKVAILRDVLLRLGLHITLELITRPQLAKRRC